MGAILATVTDDATFKMTLGRRGGGKQLGRVSMSAWVGQKHLREPSTYVHHFKYQRPPPSAAIDLGIH